MVKVSKEIGVNKFWRKKNGVSCFRRRLIERILKIKNGNYGFSAAARFPISSLVRLKLIVASSR